MSNFTNLPNGTFIMIPKAYLSHFDRDVSVGFCASAAERNVNCKWIGNAFPVAPFQNLTVFDVVENPGYYNITKIAGIAINAIDEELTEEAIDFARSKNIPVVTYDSDAPRSNRMALISTNHSAFGQELGKVLNQLNPIGGGYVMITGPGLNMQQRAEGVRNALKATNWVELSPPLNCVETISLSLEIMNKLGADPMVKGVISLGGWPMWDEDPKKFKEIARTYNSKMTTVIADSSQIQMDLMNQGYVDGLVGQLPLIIGSLSFEVLMNITQGKELSKKYYGTHLLEVLRVPLQLPPVQMNYNYIGGYAAFGYTLFFVAALLSIGLLYWTYVNRNTRTLRASQPVFMAMLCGGSLMMASAMIPLSITDEKFSQKVTDAACVSIPWLFTIGFCTIFSALFTKTWRIVRILEKAARFQRVQITVREVLYPYVSLLLANIIILTCWSVINPLVYERTNNIGTDGWNRIISSYGHCVSSNHDATGTSAPYLGSLAAVNGGLLGLANIMAYRARNISTEFGESQYISIVMFSMLQAFMIGVPLLFFVVNQPLAYYVVVVLLDFAICMATLLFMFVPKILAHIELERKQEAKPKGSARCRSSTTESITESARQISTLITSWFVRSALVFSWRQQTTHEDRCVGSPNDWMSTAPPANTPKTECENAVKIPRDVKVDSSGSVTENTVTFPWDVKVNNSVIAENTMTFPWDIKLDNSAIINRRQGEVTLKCPSDDIVKVDNDKNVDGEERRLQFKVNKVAQLANNKSIIAYGEGGFKVADDGQGGLKLQSNISDYDILADYNSSCDGKSDTAKSSNSAMEDEYSRWIKGLPEKRQITFCLSLFEKFVFHKHPTTTSNLSLRPRRASLS